MGKVEILTHQHTHQRRRQSPDRSIRPLSSVAVVGVVAVVGAAGLPINATIDLTMVLKINLAAGSTNGLTIELSIDVAVGHESVRSS